MLGYTGVISLCLLGLNGYHSKLAVTGTTTNEDIRGKFSNGNKNPYDRGCAGNCSAFWYGGTSRVYLGDAYDTEALSKTEPNVFVIKSFSDP